MMKKISALLLALLLICSLNLSAFAEGPELERSGSLTVNLKPRSEGQLPAADAVLKLIKVGEAQIQGPQLSYVLSPAFSDSNLSLKDLNAPGLAAQLAAYAQAHDAQGLVQKTHSEGRAVFSPLLPGLYLIVQEGSLPGCLPIVPFLVSLPVTGPDGREWLYDIEASPKIAPDPGKPDGGSTGLTVWKYWDGGAEHPASIKVNLLRGGMIYESVILSEANGWKHSWTGLSPDYVWSVAEDVPPGYEPHYTQKGNELIIVNSALPHIPENPEELQVKKLWNSSEHPESVTVELWKGSFLYSSVVLSKENGWQHCWKELPPADDWEIVEHPVPEGYYPSYSVEGSLITIKNSRVPDIPSEPVKPGGGGGLIQTGQLNWPIPLLSGAGLLLFAAGWILIHGKDRKEP